MRVIALQRVNLKQRAIDGWKSVVEVALCHQTGRVEREFYQRLVLFYYKYLLGKYFGQMKAARSIVAHYNTIFDRLKTLRRRRCLEKVWSALQENTQEMKEDAHQSDLLAARVLIFPKLKRCLLKRREIFAMEQEADIFRLRKRFLEWKNIVSEQLEERRAEIRADRHYYQKKEKTAFMVLKFQKSVEEAFDARQEYMADQSNRKRLKRSVRICFMSLVQNAWAKFFPYRQVLILKRKRRIVQGMAYVLYTLKSARQMAEKRLLKDRDLGFKLLKDQTRLIKQRRIIGESIAAKHDKFLTANIFKSMLATVKKKSLLASLLEKYEQASKLTIIRKVHDDWLLQARGRIIKNRIVPSMMAKLGLVLLKSKLAACRKEELAEQAIRKFRYRWGLKFMLLLLSINRDVSQVKKEHRLKSENKWKSVVFDNFARQTQVMKKLRLKGETIAKNSLRIKFRVWRDQALGMLTLQYRFHNLKGQVFRQWHETIQQPKRLAATFLTLKEQSMKEKIFHALSSHRQQAISYRYKLLQAITFEKCSSKRLVFSKLKDSKNVQQETDTRVVKHIDLMATHSWFKLWKKAMGESKLEKDGILKREKVLLKSVFFEWKAVAREEAVKAERERDAGRRFWLDKKKELVMTMIEKVLEKKAGQEETIANLESAKKKRAIGLAHMIGKRWLEKIRKKMKDKISVRMSYSQHQGNRLSTTNYTTYRLEKDHSVNFKYGAEQEEKLQNYLLNFKNKKRLEPTGIDEPIKVNPPAELTTQNTSKPISELERLLADYRVKTSLLQDESLPFTIRQVIQKDQADLKDKIKRLYAFVNSN